MKCLICMQIETVKGLASVSFERGEFRLVINKVPALICPNCGDAIVDEDAAIRLLNQAENASEQGIFEIILDYGN